jgi:hypothetical protein
MGRSHRGRLPVDRPVARDGDLAGEHREAGAPADDRRTLRGLRTARGISALRTRWPPSSSVAVGWRRGTACRRRRGAGGSSHRRRCHARRRRGAMRSGWDSVPRATEASYAVAVRFAPGAVAREPVQRHSPQRHLQLPVASPQKSYLAVYAVTERERDRPRAHRNRRPRAEASTTLAQQVVRCLGLQCVDGAEVSINDDRLVQRRIRGRAQDGDRACRKREARQEDCGTDRAQGRGSSDGSRQASAMHRSVANGGGRSCWAGHDGSLRLLPVNLLDSSTARTFPRLRTDLRNTRDD